MVVVLLPAGGGVVLFPSLLSYCAAATVTSGPSATLAAVTAEAGTGSGGDRPPPAPAPLGVATAEQDPASSSTFYVHCRKSVLASMYQRKNIYWFPLLLFYVEPNSFSAT